jgi:hypothetical protein
MMHILTELKWTDSSEHAIPCSEILDGVFINNGIHKREIQAVPRNACHFR